MFLTDDRQRLKMIFDVALQTRNLEIGLLWQRSIFFWGLIAASFLAYASEVNTKHCDLATATGIASFGTVCSFIWTLANRGSKYWQQAWERKAAAAEAVALESSLLDFAYMPDADRLHWWGQLSENWHFSVSRLAIALSDLTVLVWIFLTARVIPGPNWPKWITNNSELIIAVAFATYALVVFRHCQSQNNRAATNKGQTMADAGIITQRFHGR